jgi:Ulp1 family protease
MIVAVLLVDVNTVTYGDYPNDTLYQYFTNYYSRITPPGI